MRTCRNSPTPSHTTFLSESSGKKLYGEETNSAYWSVELKGSGV